MCFVRWRSNHSVTYVTWLTKFVETKQRHGKFPKSHCAWLRAYYSISHKLLCAHRLLILINPNQLSIEQTALEQPSLSLDLGGVTSVESSCWRWVITRHTNCSSRWWWWPEWIDPTVERKCCIPTIWKNTHSITILNRCFVYNRLIAC
jgi:hypothetical protein